MTPARPGLLGVAAGSSHLTPDPVQWTYVGELQGVSRRRLPF